VGRGINCTVKDKDSKKAGKHQRAMLGVLVVHRHMPWNSYEKLLLISGCFI
jgi:hypothetical protein